MFHLVCVAVKRNRKNKHIILSLIHKYGLACMEMMCLAKKIATSQFLQMHLFLDGFRPHVIGSSVVDLLFPKLPLHLQLEPPLGQNQRTNHTECVLFIYNPLVGY
jgi:hypothetical protein